MKRKKSFIGVSSMLALTVFLCLFFSPSLHAATFVVTRTDDPTPVAAPNGCNSGGSCSLREAILASNANGVDDVITLPGGPAYQLTITGADDDATHGDLDINDSGHSLTISGDGAATTTIDATNLQDRIFDILGINQTINISGLTLQKGNAGAENGGAIRVSLGGGGNFLNISGCKLLNNKATDGGAIWGQNGASSDAFHLMNSVVSGNSATGNGGGILAQSGFAPSIIDSTIDNNDAGGDGGGVWVQSNTVKDIRNSTISNNVAGGNGGGIRLLGLNIAMNNSTFSGNHAANGGAITMGSVNISMRNITITENTAAGQGSGIYITSGVNSSDIANSIVSSNPGSFSHSDCIENTSDDVVITSLGHNVFGDISCGIVTGTDDLFGTDPLLGPLADNGGPTLTHALLANSPAFNHGDPTGCKDTTGTDFTEDQRHHPRPLDGICDSGSVEMSSAAIDVDRLNIDFGKIALGVPNTQDIVITNSGEGTLNVSGMNLSNTTDYAIDPSDCGGSSFNLPGGGSCTVGITFMPQSEATLNATLTITSNDLVTPSLVVHLTGVGVQAPGGGICGDNVCAVGETCACQDCQNLPSCQPGGGGACGDGICSVTEDCSCQDCANEDTCQAGGGGTCGDGICAVNEDCTCADCSGDPTCQAGGGGSCGDGICAIGETCDCEDCKNVNSCKVGSQGGGGGGGGGCSLRADSSSPSPGGMGLLLLPLLLATGRILRRPE